jgi:release factor glutamine methyltransferase
MTIREALEQGRQALVQAEIENPGLEAEILLSGILKKDRIYFYAHPLESLDEGSNKAFDEAVKRRCQREPVAYILGNKEFMGMDFFVCEDVLIPRPDTEPMVEVLIDYLKEHYPQGAKILDLCTGSGAIGIALKKYFPQGQVSLSDYSKKALAVAKINAEKLVNSDITFYEGDLFTAIPPGEKFDVIVSNPPYIKASDMNNLAADIIHYEPHLALDGGETGLDFYEQICREAHRYLLDSGLLALEIGDDQRDAVTGLLVDNGFEGIQEVPDLGGHIRCLMGKITTG